jgi:hypothetical protein
MGNSRNNRVKAEPTKTANVAESATVTNAANDRDTNLRANAFSGNQGLNDGEILTIVEKPSNERHDSYKGHEYIAIHWQRANGSIHSMSLKSLVTKRIWLSESKTTQLEGSFVAKVRELAAECINGKNEFVKQFELDKLFEKLYSECRTIKVVTHSCLSTKYDTDTKGLTFYPSTYSDYELI